MAQVDPAERPALAEGLSLISRNWGWFLFRGVLALLLGILAIAFPFKAVFVFTAVFAAYAFIDGIISLISGIKGARESRHRWLSLVLSGLVGIALGVVFIVWPGASTAAYALVSVLLIAVWAIITGGLQIAAAVRLRKVIEGEWLLGISGALAVLLGIGVFAFAMSDPRVSIVAVGWMIGLYAILAGIVLVALAFKLRGAANRVHPG
jgi:uncharacterized membrane protein HdeD (DUF308 family)